MLPACTTEEKPFAIGGLTTNAPLSGTSSDTPGGACAAWSWANGAYPKSISEFQCVTLFQPDIAYPVIKVCEPMFDGAPYDYAAGGALFGFAFAGVVGLYFASHAIGLVVKAVRDM